MEQHKPNDARALIERGEIVSAENGQYMVKSLDRDGITARLKGVNSKAYDAGNRVYFFLFDDGTGRILDLLD